jgi:hypothetical protein
MDWQAFGAVGEVVGALAVVVTLVFLVRQMRQSASAIRAQTHDSAMRGFNELNVLVASRPDLAEMFERGQDDPELLQGTERIQFTFLLGSYLNQTEAVLRMYESRVLSDKEWHRFAAVIAQIMSTPGGQAFRLRNPAFSHLFAALDKHRPETPLVDHRLSPANEGEPHKELPSAR